MQSEIPRTQEGPRAGRPAMPREHIIEAALRLVDEGGAEEFSLRLLAKHLRSSTATLYRHFASKEVLLAAVGEHVLGEAAESFARRGESETNREKTADSWRPRLFAAADALYGAFEAHPHMVAVLSNGIALGPNALVLREQVLSALIDGGFTPQIASKAFTSVMHYTVGFSAQLGRPDPGMGDAGRELQEFFAALDPVRFPAITASAPFLPTALRDEFQFGLTCLIDGLAPLRTP